MPSAWLSGNRLLVRAILRGERLEDVGQAHDARRHRHLRPRQAARMAGAVHVLVVTAGELGDAAQVARVGQRFQHLDRRVDVVVDHRALAVVERAAQDAQVLDLIRGEERRPRAGDGHRVAGDGRDAVAIGVGHALAALVDAAQEGDVVIDGGDGGRRLGARGGEHLGRQARFDGGQLGLALRQFAAQGDQFDAVAERGQLGRFLHHPVGRRQLAAIVQPGGDAQFVAVGVAQGERAEIAHRCSRRGLGQQHRQLGHAPAVAAGVRRFAVDGGGDQAHQAFEEVAHAVDQPAPRQRRRALAGEAFDQTLVGIGEGADGAGSVVRVDELHHADDDAFVIAQRHGEERHRAVAGALVESARAGKVEAIGVVGVADVGGGAGEHAVRDDGIVVGRAVVAHQRHRREGRRQPARPAIGQVERARAHHGEAQGAAVVAHAVHRAAIGARDVHGTVEDGLQHAVVVAFGRQRQADARQQIDAFLHGIGDGHAAPYPRRRARSMAGRRGSDATSHWLSAPGAAASRAMRSTLLLIIACSSALALDDQPHIEQGIDVIGAVQGVRRALNASGTWQDDLGALTDPDPQMHQRAVLNLVRAGARVLPDITVLARDADWQIRARCCQVAGGIGGAPATPLLLELTRDRQVRVRELAALGLGRGAGAAAGARLLELLATDDAPVRAAAAEALGAHGDLRALEALARADADPDEIARRARIEALARVALQPAAVPELVRLLGSARDAELRRLIDAAGAVGDTRLSPPLAALLTGAGPHGRAAGGAGPGAHRRCARHRTALPRRPGRERSDGGAGGGRDAAAAHRLPRRARAGLGPVVARSRHRNRAAGRTRRLPGGHARSGSAAGAQRSRPLRTGRAGLADRQRSSTAAGRYAGAVVAGTRLGAAVRR